MSDCPVMTINSIIKSTLFTVDKVVDKERKLCEFVSLVVIIYRNRRLYLQAIGFLLRKWEYIFYPAGPRV